MLFLGAFYLIWNTKNWSFFTLPPTTSTNRSHQLPPPITATNHWCTHCHHPPMPTIIVGGWSWWWVASVVVGCGECLKWILKACFFKIWILTLFWKLKISNNSDCNHLAPNHFLHFMQHITIPIPNAMYINC